MTNNTLIYSDLQEYSDDEIQLVLNSGSECAIVEAVLSTGLNHSNINFVLNTINICYKNSNANIRGAAILALAHASRLHDNIPEKEAIDLLSNALIDNSEYVRSQAKLAVQDIEIFVPELYGKIKQN